MSQWNLSVELRGQGTDLVRTLRRSSAAARSLSRDVADARQEIQRLRAAARRDIRLSATADTSRLTREVSTAVRNANRTNQISVHTDADTTGLDSQVDAATRQASRRRRVRTPVDADTSPLNVQISSAVRRAGQNHRITLRTRINTDDQREQLDRLRELLDGLGDSATSSGRSMSSAAADAAVDWKTLAGYLAAAYAAITLGAPLAATAITTALPVAFGAIGAAALKSDREVTAAFANLQSTITDTFTTAAQPIKPYLIDGIKQLQAAAEGLEAPLSRMFAAAGPAIEPLLRGVTQLVENALPGVEAALGRSQPALEAFADAAADIGTGISNAFDSMTAGNAENFAKVWQEVGDGVRKVVEQVGETLGDLAGNESAVNAITGVFDALASAISIVGRVAENYAPIIETVLNIVNTGLDALDFSAQQIGGLWDMIWGNDDGGGEKRKEDLKGAADAALGLSDATGQAADSTNLFGDAARSTQAALDAQKKSADGLRESLLALNDVNRSGLDAQSAMEAAIDETAETAKKNAGALDMVGGKLDLNTEKARANYDALSTLAQTTGEAAAAVYESTGSWTQAQDVYERGRQQFISLADQMGLTRDQAVALANQILQPLYLKMDGAQRAQADLEMVQEKLRNTKGKSITVKALTDEGQQALEDLGFKVTHMKDGSVKVTVPTGGPRQAVGAIQGYIDGVRDGSATITITRRTNYVETRTYVTKGPSGQPLMLPRANGGLVDFYADGGMRENHLAQIVPAGSWRVWGEPETGGESYIPLAESKRPRSRAIAEETVRRLGGDPRSIEWNADGNVTDWRYDPNTGSLYSASDAGRAGHKTKKVKVKGKHGKYTTKEVEYFDIGAVERKLKSAAKTTQAWNKDLETVASRVGGDVAEALANMGEDGVRLAKKMAHGSTKYINQMAKALRDLQKTAKASLTDYTRQLTKANTVNAKFASDLARLAGMGYGDLAAQLAAQGDEAAQQLAAAAARDRKKAASANAAAKKANTTLTGDQVEQLVQIIAAVKTSKTGIHDVAAKTGLGEDDIIDVATKATGQIKSALGSRATKFLADLARAKKGLTYANGGIRAGMYATQAGIIRFAEPQTRGEAYIPLGANKRRAATAVLGDVANRFGLGLTDAGAGRVVIIREQGPLVGEQHWHVGSQRSDVDLVRRIDANNTYQLRRLARGGVAAR